MNKVLVPAAYVIGWVVILSVVTYLWSVGGALLFVFATVLVGWAKGKSVGNTKSTANYTYLPSEDNGSITPSPEDFYLDSAYSSFSGNIFHSDDTFPETTIHTDDSI